jgi:hypothetical protein
MPAKIDLPKIQKGDTTVYQFNWDDGVDPIDMRNKTIIMSFKLDAVLPDADATLTKTVVIGAVDAQAQIGRITLRLEKSETALLLPNTSYAYAVKVQESSTPEDIETTFFYGSVPVGDA